MIEAEKLKNYDPAKFKPGFASIKYNGIHGIFDPKTKQFYSRTPAVIQGLDKLIDQLFWAQSPLVGELTVPGVDFETGSGLLRNYNPVPEAQFKIFNNIIPGVPFHQRLKFLLDEAVAYWTPQINWELIHFVEVATIEQFDKYYEEIISGEEEGVCWIDPQHIYAPGKRRWQWMKRVPMKSIEAVIIEVCPGTKDKKYEHSLGHFVCQLANSKRFNVGIFKGQTDEWRQMIYDTRDNYIGEDIVVEFKAYSKYGVPVQPRFKAFRWDL